MNIFFLDRNPKVAASFHVDKHVSKMVLETAQILETVRSKFGMNKFYKPTHRNHPCVIWAGNSQANYRWLVQLGEALSSEFRAWRGKPHKSELVISDKTINEECEAQLPKPSDIWDNDSLISFPALAMPEIYFSTCAVESYRAYYKNEKAHLAKWSSRPQPDWWNTSATVGAK